MGAQVSLFGNSKPEKPFEVEVRLISGRTDRVSTTAEAQESEVDVDSEQPGQKTHQRDAAAQPRQRSDTSAQVKRGHR